MLPALIAATIAFSVANPTQEEDYQRVLFEIATNSSGYVEVSVTHNENLSKRLLIKALEQFLRDLKEEVKNKK